MSLPPRYLFILLVFFSPCFFSQETDQEKKQIDSLLQVIRSAKHDSVRVFTYLLIADIAIKEDPEKALEYCMLSKGIAESSLKSGKLDKVSTIAIKKELASALGNIGFLALFQNNAAKAREYLTSSITISKEINDMESVGAQLINLAKLELDIGNTEKSNALYEECITILSATKNTKYLGIAYNNLGNGYKQVGKLKKAVDLMSKSVEIMHSLNDPMGEAASLSSMGAMYYEQGNVARALDNFDRAIKIFEKIKDNSMLLIVLNNVGTIYNGQNELDNAMKCFERTLKISEQRQDKSGIALSYNNFATVFAKKKMFKEAIDNFKKSAAISEEVNDLGTLAQTLNNLGSFYAQHGDPYCSGGENECIRVGTKKAMECLSRGLEIAEKIHDVKQTASALARISRLKNQLKDHSAAIEFALRSLKMSKEVKLAENIRDASRELAYSYKYAGKHKEALEAYELYILMRDSLNNQSTRKASIKSQLKYEYEKQSAADSVAHAKESEIKNVELKRQSAEIRAKKNQQYALFGGLFLVCLFGVFMFNRFKVTQKQKAVIEHQKEIVEEQKKLVDEKQKEILDSIRYAKRIQSAHLPNEKIITKNFTRLLRS